MTGTMGGKASTTGRACDILLPVHNALSYVREAIDSLLECTDERQYRLLLLDDASDHETARVLEQIASAHRHIRVLRLPENRGFVAACNLGYQHSSAPFVVVFNSDVVVTPGWLDRLLTCAASDPRIASVNPLTNHASQIAVPMIPGSSYLGMDALLRQRRPQYPDVVTGVGFCMLLRRSALEQVGFFDPVFGRGYCEDSDLCMRLTEAGYRTVVADNVYVYHRGSASFGGPTGKALSHQPPDLRPTLEEGLSPSVRGVSQTRPAAQRARPSAMPSDLGSGTPHLGDGPYGARALAPASAHHRSPRRDQGGRGPRASDPTDPR